MRIAMTLNVRDEADIIEDNLNYHAAQGVDVFIVADHGSMDETPRLLERYADAGLVRLVSVEATDILDLHEQHMTRLAHAAAEAGADWVIHNDADEFWWPVVGNLKDALAGVPDRYGTLLAPRAEYPPRPGDEPWPQRLRIRELRSRHRPKVAHRPHPDLRLHGVHPANLWVTSGTQRFPGPPKLRADAALPSDEPGVELVLAPTFPIRVLHFPLRSFEQYRRRVEIALQTEEIWGRRGERARAAADEGTLDRSYERLMLSDEEVRRGLDDGSLVEDTAFAEYLAACPDAVVGGESPAGASAWPEQRRRRELAELEYDAMASLSVRLQKSARDADPITKARKRAGRKRGAGTG